MVKTALITGGASGIGKACVEKMAREGYGVVIADVNLAGAEALIAEVLAQCGECGVLFTLVRHSVPV